MRGLAISVWLISALALSSWHLLPASAAFEFIGSQLSGSIWNGITVFDLLMPMFLVAMGASIAFSQSLQFDRNAKAANQVVTILVRTTLLFLLGLVCTNSASHSSADWRIAGVLQRFAICYLAGSLLSRFLGARGLLFVAAVLLANYWGMLVMWTVPGQKDGTYSIDGNAAAFVDTLYLPGRAYFGTWDPQGLLTTLPAIAVTLLGIILGEVILDVRTSKSVKAVGTVLAGILISGNGGIVSTMIPINSYLWTPSFTFISLGAILMVTSLLYWMGDIRRHTRILRPLLFMGRRTLEIGICASLLRIVPSKQPLFDSFRASSTSIWDGSISLLLQFLFVACAAWCLHQLTSRRCI